MKIVNVEEMRRIEQAADAAGQSYASMMEMAGQATANIAHSFAAPTPDLSVLVLVGPGNNGGDGLVAARRLLQLGHPITVYVWKRDTKHDENFRQLRRKRRGVTILYADNDPDFAKLREELRHIDLVIDALLGTGVARPIEGQLADLLAVTREELGARRNPPIQEGRGFVPGIPRLPVVEAMSFGINPKNLPSGPSFADDDFMDDFDEDEETLDEDLWDDDEDWLDEEELPSRVFPQPAVLAVDCPSGLNCDTGALDPAALAADLTVTFGFPKWGQFEHPGAAACGLLSVVDIGIPLEMNLDLRAEVVEARQVGTWLPRRPNDAHKGTFGRVMIVAGSLNYAGAAFLSSASAMRAGAGLVTLALPAPLHAALAGALPETTWLPLPAPGGVHTAAGLARLLPALGNYDALLVGPGLTTGEDTRAFVEALFGPSGLDRETWHGRTVADADALNILATLPDWPARLPPLCILTPHPGEMARLTGRSIAEINGWRIEIARRYAAEWGHIVVLKGAHTVIAHPDGRLAVLPFALPVLATAGSGDVLAGAIVAMLAQGLAPFEAAVCAAYLHGHAGQVVVRKAGIAGAVARDFIDRFPEALTQLYLGH